MQKKNRKHPHQHQHKTLTKSFPYEFYEFDPFFHALRHPASQPLISAVIVPLLTDCCACVYVIVSPVILYHRVTTFREMSKHIFRFFFPPAILLALPYCTLLEIKKKSTVWPQPSDGGRCKERSKKNLHIFESPTLSYRHRHAPTPPPSSFERISINHISHNTDTRAPYSTLLH